MSAPKQTPVETVGSADEARDIAIDWQAHFGDESMSMSDLLDWQGYFEELAERFDLVEEFQENGII